MADCIYPGKTWLDTDGKRIHAHGGSVLYENGAYYWYGENKEFTDGTNGIWHYGVRMYRSVDLYNWQDLGLIIPPDEKNKNSSLHPSAMMDRPHILYNRLTGKYVCHLKIMHPDATHSFTVLTANNLAGPYEIVAEGMRPLQMNAGDFDLVAAPDGKAYAYFERVHSENICADLTPDYTGFTGHYSVHFPHPGPPYVREAPAHFFCMGKHYLFTSGTTGYLPNPSEVAVADTWHGPFTVLGNPHRYDKSNTSFHSQISSVFQVRNKKNLFVAVADRWLPGLDMGYEFYKGAFERRYLGENFGFKPLPGDEKAFFICNTSLADYVWLPVVLENGKVYLDWKDEWRIEDYE